MGKCKLAILLAASFLAVTAKSAMVYARDSDASSGSMVGRGMMGGGHMMGGGMMGGMSRMMEHCGAMMQGDRGSGRPNEQWRDRDR